MGSELQVTIETDQEREDRESLRRLAVADKLLQANAVKLYTLVMQQSDELLAMNGQPDLRGRAEIAMIISQTAANSIKVQAAAVNRMGAKIQALKRPERMTVVFETVAAPAPPTERPGPLDADVPEPIPLHAVRNPEDDVRDEFDELDETG